MFYKRLLDNMISNNFPSEQFYVHFSMDPHNILSDEVKMNAADSGFPAEVCRNFVVLRWIVDQPLDYIWCVWGWGWGVDLYR